MILGLLLVAVAFLGMLWEFYAFHIFILGLGIVGYVLGYLLFRWAKRSLPEVRMPGRSLDPKARLFLGLVLGLLAILLTGF
jgi:Trk-type K+ transport system membrane component